MKSKRLHFIDAMRAFAILMMLQGHFIQLSFKNFKELSLIKKTTGTSGSVFFDGWYFMKGITAPLFFFVTGLVFVFLLLQTHQSGKKNPRIRKGIIRSCELIFWGYLLQLNMRYFFSTFYSKTPIIYAFHVLQCIGVSLLLIIGLYLLFKAVKKIPLGLYYLGGGIVIFAIYKKLNLLEAFPENGPQLLQNMFRGPHAIFPIVPWSGFVLFGGLFGVIVHYFKERIKSIPFSIVLLSCVFILKHLTNSYGAVWLYNRLAEVLLITFIFIQLEGWFTHKWKLFLEVGQKTLFVYLWHTIVLYGGIVGLGLHNLIKEKLTAYQAIAGAVLFVAFFIFFSKLSPFFDALKAKVFVFLRIAEK